MSYNFCKIVWSRASFCADSDQSANKHLKLPGMSSQHLLKQQHRKLRFKKTGRLEIEFGFIGGATTGFFAIVRKLQ
jgi:hypothetical protein